MILSTLYEGERTATDINLFYPGIRLISKLIQPGPSDLQSSTSPGICKHILASIQIKWTGFDKESRRFMTH